MHLVWKIGAEGMVFFFHNDDEVLPVAQWESGLNPGIASAQFFLLRELLDNGKADTLEDSVVVPYAEVCNLPMLDQQLLNLPSQYPFDIVIDVDGMLHERGVCFQLELHTFVGGKKLVSTRTGCVVALDDGSNYLLSAHQYDLWNMVDEFNALPPNAKQFGENLRRFADIKQLSEKSAAILHSYLENEDVVVPKGISLVPKLDASGALELIPVIEGVPENTFQTKFDRFSKVEDVYTIENEDGKRVRIPISDTQKTELRKVKANRRVRGEAKERILQHPEMVFDTDVVDLDEFSQRVITIGEYKPRFYPFVSPYKSEWIPGILIETPQGDRHRITFADEAELNRFKEAIQAARESGQDSIQWNGVQTPIDGIDSVIQTAERRFQFPEESKTQAEQDERVLIIAENIESVEYAEPIPEEFRHRFCAVPNLKHSARLLEHQVEGVAWLQSLFMDGYPGCLLADDMGLGKTLQVLAFIEWHRDTKNPSTKPYLVTAPVSLLENWEREYVRFFDPPALTVLPVYGGSVMPSQNRLHDPCLVLTTYETLRKWQLHLCAIDWAIAILDEAQRIKTPGTLVTNAAKALKADFKIAVTGTPIENSLVDLWCITDFALPGLLGGAREFAHQYQNPLGNPDTDVSALGEHLRTRLGFHIKRRMKKDILEGLPEKHEHLIQRQMPDEQKRRYELEVSHVHQRRNDASNRQQAMLNALWAIRDISDHPYLLDKQIDLYDIDSLVHTSAKLLITIALLDDIRTKSEKVILFTERRNTQRLLARVLSEKFDVSARIINGDTPTHKQRESSAKESRQQTIDRFQASPGFNAIILSPLAVGIGLNITEANHVIHYSRHWNPAKEDQATDRVYRIGQEREVHVYYPMAVVESFKSFDVVLNELLIRKRKLASGVLFPTERAEIRPDEVYDEIFRTPVDSEDDRPLTDADIDTMDPFIFEAFIAALWKFQGYSVILTPKVNDRGADVITLSPTGNVLLQAKHSRNSVGDSPIGEILKARGFYEKRNQAIFGLAVITNRAFTANAVSLAYDNGIRLYARPELHRILGQATIRLSDVLKIENGRLAFL